MVNLFYVTTIFNLILNHFSYIVTDEIKTWGPGLTPRIVMPARYFFIQGNDTVELESLDISITGKKIFNVNLPCRIWTNVLDCKDGSFIIRYKLYEPCSDLKISINFKEKEISGFPYVFNDKVYSDDCNCDIQNISSFFNTWECGKTHKQIEKDLSIFEDINFDKLRTKLISTYNNPGAVSLCNYIIKNNLVYRKCYGQHVGFKMFMDNILLSLTRKVFLPDFEFFVNLGDWPLTNNLTEKYPIFSWSGSTDSFDIMMPTYDLTESTLENMGRVMLDMLSVQGNVKEKWNKRIPKVFWRGRDSNRARLKLIEISRSFPELFNASLTNFFFFRNEMEKYGPISKHASFYDFFDYKYQINLDGTVAAYRFPYLLAGGSLVFKQDSKYYEFFYNKTEPHKHYIPIKKDLSDLIDKIKWAIENDDQAETIGKNGRIFANENLLPKDIFCYHVQLFNEYSKKIVSDVNVLDGMEMVKQPKIENCDCTVKVKDEL